MSTTIAFVGLGSNLGDGLTTLQNAWRSIGEIIGVSCLELSSPYQSSPVGMESENQFTNAVGKLQVDISALELLDSLLTIEHEFGRRRKAGAGYQDRSLDLDMLYFGDLCQSADKLTLPHPHLADRLFVLAPMAEISPECCDPSSGETIAELKINLCQRLARENLHPQDIRKISWG
ncbi:MAG: 2-amino-4-hydroxy-6-hydroxymethyldihydropteridine diphosphokinase [Desulfotalea sp.]